MITRIVFIEYGNQQKYFDELRYCLCTFLRWHGELASDILVYTETPERYAHLPVTAISIVDRIREYSLNGCYHFRIKPCVLLDVLATYQCPTLFLDTDTFVKAGLGNKLNLIDPNNALMHKFERFNPYPGFELNNVQLPSGLQYKYSSKDSVMYNSGVLGLCPRHIDVLRDAIALIDAVKSTGLNAHTIEQTAISESLRIHGIEISIASSEVIHYWENTEKQYMHAMIARNLTQVGACDPYPCGKWIKFNWLLAQLHKYVPDYL